MDVCHPTVAQAQLGKTADPFQRPSSEGGNVSLGMQRHSLSGRLPTFHTGHSWQQQQEYCHSFGVAQGWTKGRWLSPTACAETGVLLAMRRIRKTQHRQHISMGAECYIGHLQQKLAERLTSHDARCRLRPIMHRRLKG